MNCGTFGSYAGLTGIICNSKVSRAKDCTFCNTKISDIGFNGGVAGVDRCSFCRYRFAGVRLPRRVSSIRLHSFTGGCKLVSMAIGGTGYRFGNLITSGPFTKDRRGVAFRNRSESAARAFIRAGASDGFRFISLSPYTRMDDSRIIAGRTAYARPNRGGVIYSRYDRALRVITVRTLNRDCTAIRASSRAGAGNRLCRCRTYAEVMGNIGYGTRRAGVARGT